MGWLHCNQQLLKTQEFVFFLVFVCEVLKDKFPPDEDLDLRASQKLNVFCPMQTRTHTLAHANTCDNRYLILVHEIFISGTWNC